MWPATGRVGGSYFITKYYQYIYFTALCQPWPSLRHILIMNNSDGQPSQVIFNPINSSQSSFISLCLPALISQYFLIGSLFFMKTTCQPIYDSLILQIISLMHLYECFISYSFHKSIFTICCSCKQLVPLDHSFKYIYYAFFPNRRGISLYDTDKGLFSL